MVILFEMGDLLLELFPTAAGDPHQLLAVLADAYAVGPYKPRVSLEGNLVRVEIDEVTIEHHHSDFKKLVKWCDAGQYGKARPLLERLIVENPSVSEYHRFLGQILFDLKNFEGATSSLIDALRWDPRNKSALVMMANLQAKVHRNSIAAMRYMEEAFRLAPDDITVVNNLGALEMRRGNAARARELFQRALVIDPKYTQSLYGLASLDATAGDFPVAVDGILQAIRANGRNDGFGKHMLQEALNWASQIPEDSVRTLRDGYAAKLEILGGRSVHFLPDESLTAAASIQFAELYGRDHHIVRFRPHSAGLPHLQMHELVHLELALEARALHKNCVIVSDGDHFASFKKAMDPAIRKLRSSGQPEENVTPFLRSIFHGLNARSYNAPIDLIIELRLHAEFPDLRPVQLLSLHRLLLEALASVVDAASIEYVTPNILSAVRVYNLTLAFLFEHLYGISMVSEFKATPRERDRAALLWTEAQNFWKAREGGAEYPWLLQWADSLHTSSYFDLVDEDEYLSSMQRTSDLLESVEADPFGLESRVVEKDHDTTLFQESQRKIQETQGLNQAVAHFMLDAREYFDKLSQPEIQAIAMEIAMVGANGIGPEKSGYTVKSVPGQSFTGNRLLAWYYVSFALSLPAILPKLGLPFAAEWAWAKEQDLPPA